MTLQVNGQHTSRGRATAIRRQRTSRRKSGSRKRSPKYDHLETPPHLVELVQRVGVIGLDPTSNVRSTAYEVARVAWNRHALSRRWDGYGLVYCNPPYSAANLRRFVPKMADEGDQTIGLVPAAVESAWWQRHVWQRAAVVCLVYGRIVFWMNGKPVTDRKGKELGAWFPSAFVYWGDRPDRFARVFSKIGRIVECDGDRQPRQLRIEQQGVRR